MRANGYKGLAASALIVAAAGCTGSGEGLNANGQPEGPGGAGTPPPLTADFSSIQANVFSQICIRCHIGAGAPEGLQLDAAHSYALLVGVPSTEQPTVLRVKAGDPDNSYIIQKLEGAPTITGAQMPFGEPPLPQATIDVIRQWIANGAQNDSSTTAAAEGRDFVVTTTAPQNGSVVTTASPSIVVGFSHELDASLVNDATVTLEKSGEPGLIGTEPMASADREALGQVLAERIPVAISLADGNATAIVIRPRTPLAPGTYRIRLRGTDGGALADLNAQALGFDYSFEFKVDVAP